MLFLAHSCYGLGACVCVCVGAQEGLSLQGVGLESHNLLFRPSFILVS